MDIKEIRGELCRLGCDLSELRRNVLYVNTKNQTNIELENLIGRIDPLLEDLDEALRKMRERRQP